MPINRPLTTKEEEAWQFAKEAHKTQVRKFIGLPYFDAHVSKVNGIVKLYTTDEDLLCAALLHDTIEDCFDTIEEGYRVISEKFGKVIADLVMELTSSDDDIKNKFGGSKAKYLSHKMLNMSDGALLIKLADRLQNIADAFTVSVSFRNSYSKETRFIISEIESNRLNMNRNQQLLIGDIKSKLRNIKRFIKRFSEF